VLHLDELLTDAVTDEYQFKTDPTFDRELESREFKHILAESIKQLSEREQIILNLYYNDELTLKEIGAVLDLTESRISQIHSSIIVKLRSMMKKVLPYN
jgi:RNA polymerase sigma factor for flagellar operon FliA